MAENLAKLGHEGSANGEDLLGGLAVARERETIRSSRSSEPSKHEKLEREKQMMLVMDEMIRQVSEFTAEEKIVDFLKISKKPVLNGFIPENEPIPPPRRANWD